MIGKNNILKYYMGIPIIYDEKEDDDSFGV
jgi:hypothetical protein